MIVVLRVFCLYHFFFFKQKTAYEMRISDWSSDVRSSDLTVGLEYMHIADVEERRFLQERFEGVEKLIEFTPEGKKAILAAVIRGEEYEKFLGRKYVGTKRFGLDGGESMLPALESVIKQACARCLRDTGYGMSHSGRLNGQTGSMLC